MKNKPLPTIFKTILVAFLSLLGACIVALVVAWGIYLFGPRETAKYPTGVRQLCSGFSKTIYSNANPASSDVINLCDAGNLRPAIGNIRLGGAERGEKPYNYSAEILMVLNQKTRNLGDAGLVPTKPTELKLEVQAITEPKPKEYLLFLVGTEHEIMTSGRTFIVKLLEINREPTKDGYPYYSYHFIINEK